MIATSCAAKYGMRVCIQVLVRFYSTTTCCDVLLISCSQALLDILSPQNDAAVYISAVLQHTVERLVAGALTSCDKADFRSEASTHMDARHLQVGLK